MYNIKEEFKGLIIKKKVFVMNSTLIFDTLFDFDQKALENWYNIDEFREYIEYVAPTVLSYPTESVATEPVATPVEPEATPTEPVATPVEPVATPVEPVATPAEPVATDITSTEPIVIGYQAIDQTTSTETIPDPNAETNEG